MPLTFIRPIGPGWLAPRGRSAAICLIAALVLTLGAGVVLTTSAAQRLPDDAVFRYGETVVTEAELADRVSSLEALYGVRPPGEGTEAEKFRRDAAKSMALGMVLEREAARRDIVVSEKQARSELAKIIGERLGGDREAFTRFLADEGLSEDTILEEIERTIATNRLYEDVVKDVDPATKADARKEYDVRPEDMRAPETRRIRNIVVSSEVNAKAVLAELEKGTAFPVLARRASLDAASKDEGGLLGTVREADLDPAYAEAAFSAKNGELFGPVQSQFGWNVGIVEQVIPGKPLSYQDVEATLIAGLTTRAQLAAWRNWIGDALKRADIEYADEYRPADPTSPPSDGTLPESPGEDR